MRLSNSIFCLFTGLLCTALCSLSFAAKPTKIDQSPESFLTLAAYLTVEKDAEQAIKFYTEVLGAMLLEKEYDPGGTNRIFHSELQFGDSRLMLSDNFPEFQAEPLNFKNIPVSLTLLNSDPDKTVAKMLKKGATIIQACFDAPWGHRYCQVKDPYGFSWSIYYPNSPTK